MTDEKFDIDIDSEEEDKDEYTRTCVAYKIFCKTDKDVPIYIGSTNQTIEERWRHHKKDYTRRKGKFAIHEYFDKYNGIDNFDIEVLETIEHTDTKRKIRQYVRMLEQKWMDKLRDEGVSICNIRNSFMTEERYKEYDKKYFEENREKRAEKTQCDCGGKYIYTHKARHERTKIHQEYLTTILQPQSEPQIQNQQPDPNRIECECGSSFHIYEKERHKQTKRHQKYLTNLQHPLPPTQNQVQKINCPCGTIYTKQHKARHERSQKHQEYLNRQ